MVWNIGFFFSISPEKESARRDLPAWPDCDGCSFLSYGPNLHQATKAPFPAKEKKKGPIRELHRARRVTRAWASDRGDIPPDPQAIAREILELIRRASKVRSVPRIPTEWHNWLSSSGRNDYEGGPEWCPVFAEFVWHGREFGVFAGTTVH